MSNVSANYHPYERCRLQLEQSGFERRSHNDTKEQWRHRDHHSMNIEFSVVNSQVRGDEVARIAGMCRAASRLAARPGTGVNDRKITELTGLIKKLVQAGCNATVNPDGNRICVANPLHDQESIEIPMTGYTPRQLLLLEEMLKRALKERELSPESPVEAITRVLSSIPRVHVVRDKTSQGLPMIVVFAPDVKARYPKLFGEAVEQPISFPADREGRLKAGTMERLTMLCRLALQMNNMSADELLATIPPVRSLQKG